MKVMCAVGLGPKFFEKGAACLLSAKVHAEGDYQYGVFCSDTKLEKCKGIANGTEAYPTDGEVRPYEGYFDFRGVPKNYRIGKTIPFYLKDLLDHELLFLDTDGIVFKPCLERLFEYIEEVSLLLFGSYVPDDEPSRVHMDYELFFNKLPGIVGMSFRNARINGGLIGSALDAVGRKFGECLKSLSFKNDLFGDPSDYFGVEPHFILAEQLSHRRGRKRLSPPSRGIVTTTQNLDRCERK
ncbi:MAG: hypothetical protein AAGB06_02780 [Verrucomicrobiota bacterium]